MFSKFRAPNRRRALAVAAAGVVAAVGLSAPAHADQVTPGNFTGYAFDQCLTPSQSAMDTWMEHSPFTGVGIYISGDSRWCRNQPNLTAEWVTKQLDNGWRLLPITLGPQVNCLDRFPRYKDDEVISPKKKNRYVAARKQARKEAITAVAAAKKLGIDPGSTLWYDLEGWVLDKNKVCDRSAMWFLHAWTNHIHKRGYVSGVYSSVGSGIKILDRARINQPDKWTLPDRIWLARWDGLANLVSPEYFSNYGWMPHARVKQYLGGHNETWGGVTINIDSNFMSLGKGTTAKADKPRCREKVALNLTKYPMITAQTNDRATLSALQCLLRKQKLYRGPLTGTFDTKTLTAANAFQTSNRVKVRKRFNTKHWTMLLSAKGAKTVKRGSKGGHVRVLQRALTAATGLHVPVTGVFDARTESVTKTWQGRVRVRQSGVVNADMWALLKQGTR